MDAPFVCFQTRKRQTLSRSKLLGRNRQLHSEALEARQLLAADVLWISEFMASNSPTLRSDDREYHDWIEIYNPNAEAVSLEGWYLTDDAGDLNKWQFPAVEVASDGYLVVFASNQNLVDPAEELRGARSEEREFDARTSSLDPRAFAAAKSLSFLIP